MTTSAIILTIIHVLNVAAIVTIIFFQRKESPTRFAWILVLVFVPVVGFVLYMLFGHNYARRERIQYGESASRELYNYVQNQIKYTDRLTLADPRFVQLARMNLVNDETLLTNDNSIRIFTNGRAKFEALLEDLRAAEKYIHLLYFIFRTDELGNEILAILAEKAAAGLDVKIVYDDIGNVNVSGWGFRKLRKAGGKIFRYSPLITGFVSANYRNHRKLAIIDGKIGYIGGMNIGTEYIKGRKKLVPWRDTHLRMEGTAVGMMESIFMGDYVYAARKQDKVEDLGRFFSADNNFTGCSTVQILASAPESGKYHIHHAYTKMISSAEKYVYIHTPYLIPDRTVFDTLSIAVASGVDVRIMLPQFPDKHLVYYASLDNAARLCALGVKIYLYEGFLHSKMMVADGQALSIGSANLDVRSFFLSYEANAFIFDQGLAEEQTRQFIKDMENCVLVDSEYFKRLPLPIKFMMPVCQLFSPLL